MVVSTYQAASGAGAAAMEELALQTREVFPFLFMCTFLSLCRFQSVIHLRILSPKCIVFLYHVSSILHLSLIYFL
jgi:aspartate-semialdehyde dehydrogenase